MTLSSSNEINSALMETWRQHSSQIYKLCLRKTRDKNRAQDFFQDIFIRFYENWKRIRDYQNVGGWLYVMASHYLTDVYRGEMRRPDRGYCNYLYFSDFSLEYDRCPAPKSGFLIQKQIEEIRKSLDSLDQMIADLRFAGGFKEKEIADIIGISKAGVSKRVRRILHVLSTEVNLN